MKRFALLLLVAAALLAFPALADDHEKTLTGEYHWNKGVSGDIQAIFTPDGEGKWNVVFNFDFRDKPRVYTGVVTGSMDGKLEGKVKNESQKRTFTLEGSFTDGVFEGNHAETTPGRERNTGTMTLK